MTGWLVIHASLTRVACVPCTFLIISFLVLVLIAPVWIPVAQGYSPYNHFVSTKAAFRSIG